MTLIVLVSDRSDSYYHTVIVRHCSVVPLTSCSADYLITHVLMGTEEHGEALSRSTDSDFVRIK